MHEPQWYLEGFGAHDFDVTAWQTTYFHVLEGREPVLEWVRGTTLRPVLKRLQKDRLAGFLDEYGALLREAYPARDGKTVFPFKRIFVVAKKS